MFRIPTYHNKLKLCFDVHVNGKASIIIVGYDEDSGTKYFWRRIRIDGKEKVEIPMPLTPGILSVDVSYEHVEDKKPIVRDVCLKPLRYRSVWSDDTQEFIDLAEYIVKNIGHLDAGEYPSRNGKFMIVVKNDIEVDTPARIEQDWKFIEVSKDDFNNLTAYEGMVVLCHEYGHGFRNKNIEDEFEADRHGNDIYLALGYPKTEIMYTYENVFSDTHENRKRTKAVYNRVLLKQAFGI